GDGDGEDARGERDLVPHERVRVSGAVPALVRVPDDRHHTTQEADRLEDPGAEERVLLHDLLLLGRERSGLRKDRGGHADLAERVEERRVPEISELVLAHPETLADGDRVRRDLALVVLAVVVARDDR